MLSSESVREILSKTDHTALSPTAAIGDIQKLCREAAHFKTASVCVAPSRVTAARSEFAKLGVLVPICTVIGFPNGYNTTETKIFETQRAVIDGADEIDTVINVGDVKDGRFDRILSEINLIKESCNGRTLKVIIECANLTEEEKIRMCGVVSCSSADFLKTSTGFASGGASFDDVRLLKANLKNGTKLKAAGGINTLEDAYEFLTLGADRLGSSRLVGLARKYFIENGEDY